MALYSVWDWNRNLYRVYTTPTHVSVGDDPVPPKPSIDNPIGASPDTGVKPLPPGAKFIGYEHLPRGEIRRMPSSLVDLGDDAGGGSGWTQPILMFGAGALTAVWLSRLWGRRMRSNKKRSRRRR